MEKFYWTPCHTIGYQILFFVHQCYLLHVMPSHWSQGSLRFLPLSLFLPYTPSRILKTFLGNLQQSTAMYKLDSQQRALLKHNKYFDWLLVEKSLALIQLSSYPVSIHLTNHLKISYICLKKTHYTFL